MMQAGWIIAQVCALRLVRAQEGSETQSESVVGSVIFFGVWNPNASESKVKNFHWFSRSFVLSLVLRRIDGSPSFLERLAPPPWPLSRCARAARVLFGEFYNACRIFVAKTDELRLWTSSKGGRTRRDSFTLRRARSRCSARALELEVQILRVSGLLWMKNFHDASP